MSYRIERNSVSDRWYGLQIETQKMVAECYELDRTNGFIVDRDVTEEMVLCGENVEAILGAKQ